MKKLFAIFMITSTVSLLHADIGNSGYGIRGYTSGPQYSLSETPPSPDQKADQQLAVSIKNELLKEPTNKFVGVSVTAHNGYVTLRGSVPTQKDKDALEHRVSNMDGVRNVNNQLTIQNANPNDSVAQSPLQEIPEEVAADDQSITSRIQQALQAAFAGKYNNVSITVSRGYITLKGSVPSQEEKENLEQLIRSIFGVKGVTNQITIKKQ